MLKVHIWFKKKKCLGFNHTSVSSFMTCVVLYFLLLQVCCKNKIKAQTRVKKRHEKCFICYALTLLRHKMSNQYGFLYPHSNQTHLSTCIHRCTCFVESLWTCRHKNPKNLKELSKKLLMSLKDLIKSLSCPAVTSVLTSTGESSCCQSCSCPHSPKHTYNPLN